MRGRYESELAAFGGSFKFQNLMQHEIQLIKEQVLLVNFLSSIAFMPPFRRPSFRQCALAVWLLPISSQRVDATNLARGRKGVIISINETCSGGSGLRVDWAGPELGHFAAPVRQAVAVHCRFPRLRRRLRQDWMYISLADRR